MSFAPSIALGALRLFGEITVGAVGPKLQPLRVPLLEVVEDRLVGHVWVVTPHREILHVPAPFRVILVKERIVPPIELERMHSEALTETQVERGRRFHPAALQVKFGEAVPKEKVSPGQLEEFLRGEMVPHVSVAHPGGNAHGPSSGCQKSSLWYAKPSLGAEAIAGSKVSLILARIVRIVENVVAYRVIELHGARDGGCSASRRLMRKSAHIRVAAVDKLRSR
jgi:hypothetical protein